MPDVTFEHFKRAAEDIAAHGDNDTLPFDADNRFVSENVNSLAKLAFAYFEELQAGSDQSARTSLNALHIFSERLLVPTGDRPVFGSQRRSIRFWNIYFNMETRRC